MQHAKKYDYPTEYDMPAISSNGDYLRRTALLAQHVKHYTYECMHVRRGHKVLDVGCGKGVDTSSLAGLVGSCGHVVGVDNDIAILTEAEKATKFAGVSDRVSYHLASAQQLPFAANSFDAVRAERLLQVLPAALHPVAVINEIERVCKPKGYVVLTDIDWGTFSVSSRNPQLERLLTSFYAHRLCPNGFAGQGLYRIMKHAQFSDIDIKHYPMVYTSLAATPLVALCEAAKKAGVATGAIIDHWLSDIKCDDAQGCFYASVNHVVVSGQLVRNT